MATKVQLRRDTLANWELNNPVLLEGEMGLITDEFGTDSVEFKIGDGVSEWIDLPIQKNNKIVKKTEEGWNNTSAADRLIKDGVQAALADDDGKIIYSVVGNGVTDFFDLPAEWSVHESTKGEVTPIVFDKAEILEFVPTTDWVLSIASSGHSSKTVVKVVIVNAHDSATGTTSISYTGDSIDPTKRNVFILSAKKGNLLVASNTLQDAVDVEDETPPASIVLSLNSANTLGTITPNEAISSFTITANTFNANGDPVSSVTLSNSRVQGGVGLFDIAKGGTGTSDGNATIQITATVSDVAGNEATLTSNVVTFNDETVVNPPVIINWDDGDIATYFDYTGTENIFSTSGNTLVITSPDSGTLARGDEELNLKDAFEKSVANGETARLQIDNFTWDAPAGAFPNNNDDFMLGLMGSNGYKVLISSTSATNQTDEFYVQFTDASYTDIATTLSNIAPRKGDSFRVEYTRNAATPASSVIKVLYDNAGVWTSLGTINADFGDSLGIVSTMVDRSASGVKANIGTTTLSIL